MTSEISTSGFRKNFTGTYNGALVAVKTFKRTAMKITRKEMTVLTKVEHFIALYKSLEFCFQSTMLFYSIHVYTISKSRASELRPFFVTSSEDGTVNTSLAAVGEDRTDAVCRG